MAGIVLKGNMQQTIREVLLPRRRVSARDASRHKTQIDRRVKGTLCPFFVLTTDHPKSSNGAPVLFNVMTGQAYTPSEHLHWTHAAEAALLLADELGREQVRAFLKSWPEGPQLLEVL